MYGIEIAETDHSVLVRLDKDILSRETIDRTIGRLKEGEEPDYSHVGYVSDEEQADLEAILNAMTDEEKEKPVNSLKDKANKLKKSAVDAEEQAMDYFNELKTKGSDAMKEYGPKMEAFIENLFKGGTKTTNDTANSETSTDVRTV